MTPSIIYSRAKGLLKHMVKQNHLKLNKIVGKIKTKPAIKNLPEVWASNGIYIQQFMINSYDLQLLAGITSKIGSSDMSDALKIVIKYYRENNK